MILNLKTQMKAVSRLSPSILENYVTKDSLNEKLNNYVTETALDEKNFVTEVENPIAGVVYGRSKVNGTMIWTAVEFPDAVLLFGANKVDTTRNLTEQGWTDFMSTLNPFYPKAIDVHKYEPYYNATSSFSGYFWFLCSKRLKEQVKLKTAGVSITSGEDIYYDGDTEVSVKLPDGNTETTTLHCYKTAKFAITGDKDSPINYEFTVETLAE